MAMDDRDSGAGVTTSALAHYRTAAVGAALADLVATLIWGHHAINPKDTAQVRRGLMRAFMDTVESLIALQDKERERMH